jgi:hypothetical protein
MTQSADPVHPGAVPDPQRLADTSAIRNLVIAYAYAVDDKDWARWVELFEPDAVVDYRSSGGIQGTPAEIAEWFPDAMGLFTSTMHSVLTHEITFTGDDTATGRSNLINRNGLVWEGKREFLDVYGFYVDEYLRTDGVWRFTKRTEDTRFFEGGAFADLLRNSTGLDS